MPEYKRPPYMKWYARDWRGDGALRMCSFAARGLWADLISIIHDQGEPYGYLLVNGTPPADAQLSRMLGGSAKEIRKLLTELEYAGVFSRNGDGAIFSRRMIRDKAKEEKDRENGRGGGNPRLKASDNRGVNPLDKAQIPEPEPEPEAVARAREETSNEMNRLNKLFGFDERNWTVHAANIRFLIDLKAEGCDFERHIFPAAEQMAKGNKNIRSLAYIRPKTLELRDAAQTIASLPIPFEQTDERGWKDRMAAWGAKGLWSPKWGLKPDDAGCKCPPKILAMWRTPPQQESLTA